MLVKVPGDNGLLVARMNDRYAVIGSNSFSGSHFVKKLLNEGHDVLGLSRSDEVDPVFRPYEWSPHSGRWTFHRADLNDVEAMRLELLNFRPNFVVNFAAQSMVAQSWENPEHWYTTNILGIVGLCNVLGELPDLEKYVHVTTPEVYGSTGGWISESDNYHPTTPYAISRAAGDMHLGAMQREHGLPICFTRAANVYGEGQQLYRIIPRSLMYARLGRSLRLDGGGHSTRSFIHINDVADATYAVARQGIAGAAYHVSTDEITSVRALVQRVCDLTGATFGELVTEGPERPGKDDTYMLDSSRIRSELGWEPRVSLTAGLAATLAWVDENLALLEAMPDRYVHKK